MEKQDSHDHPNTLVLVDLIFYLYLIFGWINFLKGERSRKSSFSIIIPIRNEALTIQQLLTCSLNQDYSKEQCKIIEVDDFSTGDTIEKVHTLIKIK